MEYWNSSANRTSTGRPVDAIICPVAPYPAARPEKYHYYGYSVWVNSLDYSAVVVPVTTVDKKVDVVDSDFKPRNNDDKLTHEYCKLIFELLSDCSQSDSVDR
jgi:amidase